MFRQILISAGVAGVLAALALTLLQAVLITPLILQAETYEDGAAPHEHADAAPIREASTHEAPVSIHETTASTHETTAEATPETTPALAAHQHEHAAADEHQHEHEHAPLAAAAEHQHHHDADEWKPADGLQRTLFTLTSNIVMGFAYALLLTGIYVAWRRPSGLAQGLLFGLAGFAVFFAAPGLGLPPELPGTAAAELTARQQWWVGTAAATAVGLALLFMQKNIVLRIIGLAAIAAPHWFGAPQPETHASLAPEQLQNHFRWATTFGNAVFWLLLGAISALAFKKFSAARSALD